MVSLPTTTLQPKVLGFVWCTLSNYLFPKAMDNLWEVIVNKRGSAFQNRPIGWLLAQAAAGPQHVVPHLGIDMEFESMRTLFRIDIIMIMV